MTIRFPAPLKPGDAIAVCAVSSGVPEVLQGRLDASLQALRDAGYRVIEGATLRQQHKNASGSAAERLADLNRFLFDPEIKAILPPWGGELAMELLPLLDWARLATLPPKWFGGFSDVSTLAVPLTLRAGWASLHCPNLFDLSLPERREEMAALWHGLQHGIPPVQQSFAEYWRWDDSASRFAGKVRSLHGEDFVAEGRLIGGCLDTLSRLMGTPYFDLREFKREAAILYLENCEMPPCELLRSLTGMRLAGVFDGLAALVLGRSSGPDAANPGDLTYDEAVARALAGLACPVLLDADIGHVPPQWTLLNGASVRLSLQGGTASLLQHAE